MGPETGVLRVLGRRGLRFETVGFLNLLGITPKFRSRVSIVVPARKRFVANRMKLETR
jgi:hypothetical protein